MKKVYRHPGGGGIGDRAAMAFFTARARRLHDESLPKGKRVAAFDEMIREINRLEAMRQFEDANTARGFLDSMLREITSYDFRSELEKRSGKPQA